MKKEINSFIGKYQIEEHSVTDDLISYFDYSESTYRGIVLDESGLARVDLNIKDSFNIDIPPNSNEQCFRNYLGELQKAVNKYITEYEWCNKGAPWTIIENTTIQKYLPGGGFKAWHFERMNAVYPTVSRHLVFMTYLNDVEENGVTEFYYQNITIKPIKGLTLIWPADWTHTHRGVPSMTCEKYIISGWLNFVSK